MTTPLRRDALALLLRLLNSPYPSILGEILFDTFSSVANELLDDGFLESAGVADYLAQGDEHFHEIEWCAASGSYRYFCSAVGWVTVPTAQVRRYRLVMDRLLLWLGDFFELGTLYRPTSLCESLLWHLGVARFGSYKVHLYFVRRLEVEGNLPAFINTMRREGGRTPAIIVSSSHTTPACLEMPWDKALVPLEHLLERRDDQCVLDHTAVYAALSGHPPNALPSGGIGLRFSTDYRQVHWNGICYSLTKKQAAVVEALDREGGRAHKDLLQAEANTNEALHRIMRNRVQGKSVAHPLWNTLIKPAGNGYYCLEPG
ncbi:hypothetical protein AB833_04050 [Chromatiales bacterium (ex Bugula neritina AB1)]|nr:hypothetical protein AB833_04050 [Chromatiales bacterium (ex Bugula neritina AB1)]